MAGLDLPCLLDIFLTEEEPGPSIVITAQVHWLEDKGKLHLDEYSVLGRWLSQILASA